MSPQWNVVNQRNDRLLIFVEMSPQWKVVNRRID
jgi:hypothetical protein